MKYKPIEIGDKFSRLTVIKFDHKDNKSKKYWLCKCECGKILVVRDDFLKNKNTKSCGCLAKDTIKINRLNITYSYKTNRYVILGNKIKCYTSNNEVFYISKESEWVLKKYCWSVDSAGYVQARKRDKSSKTKIVRIHRVLMKNEIKKGFEIDHIDGNPTNNCLENLRVVTHAENTWNTKRNLNYGIFKNRNKIKESYRVSVCYKMDIYNLGCYPTLEEARKVRDEWEDNHERKEYFRQ